ncbi:hypothetical protein K6Y31_20620 [Motilimonas cestriensis]|uniref:Cysteine-rich CPCC domain-containing protein n=1 Tax=Motilimonas cestriensis TaxID=2742685 RepID=A0ABS8WDQ3_9GAMM|nr:hypothetical protein [Motilimonas cestriensis]
MKYFCPHCSLELNSSKTGHVNDSQAWDCYGCEFDNTKFFHDHGQFPVSELAFNKKLLKDLVNRRSDLSKTIKKIKLNIVTLEKIGV